MKKVSILILLTIFSVFLSCKKEIDIDLNNDKTSRLVVSGRFTNETKSHRIILSRTSDYFKNEQTPRETGASVKILEEGNSIPIVLTEVSDGIYETTPTVKGIVGKNYTLEIITKDGKQYNSTSYLDTVPNIDNVISEYTKDPFARDKNGKELYTYELSISFQDIPIYDNNYMLNVFLDDKLLTDTLRERIYFNDYGANGLYYPEIPFYQIKKEYIDKDTVNLKVELSSISKVEYDYFYSLMYETDYRGSIFDGPPANISTNITNGALGFFSVSAISSFETKIIKKH